MNEILIVDDDRQVLEQLKAILTASGHKVAFIPRSDFLFERLKKETFDLILLDINMPGTNGIELLDQLKADDRYQKIPVIMVTGESDETLLARCFELGATDYITKPISEVVLKARVGAALNAQSYIARLIEQQEALSEQEVLLEKQKGMQYRLSSLSAQMNPHFVFNSLSAIQYYLLDQKVDGALDYISDFSSLMRMTLDHSRKRYISLADEVKFLELYLTIESHRFEDKFKYELEMEEDLDPDNTFLPPMLIQPHVENAIIHGLSERTDGGELKILFSQKGEDVLCSVEDNGIGRKKSDEIKNSGTRKKHKSLATSITKTRLELLNSLEQDGFSLRIQDQEDSAGNATGTKITLSIPGDLEG